MKSFWTKIVGASLLAAIAGGFGYPLAAQDTGNRVASVTAAPASLDLIVGETATVTFRLLDSDGAMVEGATLRIFGQGVQVDAEEDNTVQVTGTSGGDFRVIALVAVPPGSGGGQPPQVEVPVTVSWPAVSEIEILAGEGRLYAGTTVTHSAVALHADGSDRPDAAFSWSSSDPTIASVDRFGNVRAHQAGAVTIFADFSGTRGSFDYQVPAFPATSIEVRGGREQARTGDVLTFEAVATSASGSRITDLPVSWLFEFVPDDTIKAPGAAGVVKDGKFVGEVPGVYTVLASAGSLMGRTTVDVRPRDAVHEVEIMGHGTVYDVHTSDLWVFEGVDGRDYAVTGTWGADGYAYFWDVTDPTNILRIDSVQVDARTVNDVKVSPDGRYAALSREGASNRRNGVVIIDLSNPQDPEVASTFDDGLTGGVHNMFAMDDYLFALSGGDKYVILDVRDIRNPTYVSEYNHPNSRIHDVWVHDGVAYSAEWGTGVVVVDVGNGRWGGSIENPVFVTNFPYPVGRTHAAFPYYQEDTGKFYLFLGDEIMGRGEGAAWRGVGLNRIPEKGGTPVAYSGYIHIIDFTDPENPVDVARYEVPEFGTHNLWVEDDKLYVAYYEGGVRVVDVSGELMGNLATQGREISVFKAFDPNGFAPNAAMAWGPQPYKGNLFFSDFNSGLWAIKIKPRTRPAS